MILASLFVKEIPQINAIMQWLLYCSKIK